MTARGQDAVEKGAFAAAEEAGQYGHGFVTRLDTELGSLASLITIIAITNLKSGGRPPRATW